MELSRNLSVSSTNASNGRPSALRVYKCGTMVAEVLINQRNPLGYLQRIVNGSKYLRELSEQLSANSDYHQSLDNQGADWTLTLEDFDALRKEAGLNVHLHS